jgi:hypothetical protein
MRMIWASCLVRGLRLFQLRRKHHALSQGTRDMKYVVLILVVLIVTITFVASYTA